MANTILDDPALAPMFFWYSVSVFNKIYEHGVDAVMDCIEEAQKFSLETPLFVRDSRGKFPEVELGPPFGKRSGPYVAVLLSAFLVYEQHLRFGKKAVIPDSSKLLGMANDAFQAWDKLGYRGEGEEVEEV